jgi:hypothetical protein
VPFTAFAHATVLNVAVGMVFIYIFVGLALCGVGGAIGVWYGKHKAVVPLSQVQSGSYTRVI